MTPRPARAFAAGLLLLGLAGCTDSGTGARGSAKPTPTAEATHRSAPSTHDNEKTTRAYAAWLLHAVPMPEGAREWKKSPTEHFRHMSSGYGPSDDAYLRTTWWTVPLTPDAFQAWVHQHVPNGLRDDGETGASYDGSGLVDRDLALRGPSTQAHSPSVLSLAYTRFAPGAVAVRVDTFVGPRRGRTAFVPTDATSVTVQRRTEWAGPVHRKTRSSAVIIDEPRDVARLVDLINRQPAEMVVPYVHGCMPILRARTWMLIFHTPGGPWTAKVDDNSCYPGIVLRREGTKEGPVLEPRPGFTTALARIFRAASAPASPHS